MRNEIKLAEKFLDNHKKGYLMLSKKEFTNVMVEFATTHMKGLLEFMKIPQGEIIKLYFENLNMK